ncbi:MAG TPA: ABC transporter permease [Gemmatimonadaceae bacterium]|nr:ABC transporter permease [Gemmatimonadaceae bacterium]
MTAPMRVRRKHHAFAAIAAVASSILLLFLVLPVVHLVIAAGAGGASRLFTDAELRQSLALTAITATAAALAAALCGTPLAWLLARRDFRGRALISAILDIPLLIPHPVAGIALLLFLGRGSALGAGLLAAGLRIVGTPLGIIAAMLFVSAPLFVSGAREAFARVDPRLEGVARTLGDPPWRAFRRITLPLAARGLIAAGVVTWARAVSEFGAIVILAYNPKVVSVLSYDRFNGFGLSEALPVAAALVLLSIIPLTALRALRMGAEPTGT